MTPQNSQIEFTQARIDKVFTALTSVDTELKAYFDRYLLDEYKADCTERLSYIDIGEIARFLVEKVKAGKTDFFQKFFIQTELILSNCDSYIENLIVVGLFEGIQNVGGKDIDYYYGFDKWLQPSSKKKWDSLIDTWEGKEWRQKNK